MAPQLQHSQSRSLANIWREFIQAELRLGSRIGTNFDKARFGGYDNKILTLYFEDENLSIAAKGQIARLKQRLPSALLPCDRIDFRIGYELDDAGFNNSPLAGEIN